MGERTSRQADPAMLAPLGFDAVEEAVYRSLVEQPGSGAASLCEAGLDVEAVTHALQGLVERGLASAERHDDGLRYQAAPPLLALGPVLESRRAALYRVEHLLAEMAESHRAAQSRVSGAPVEVLTGAAAIRRRLVAMQRDARYEVRSLVPAMDSPVVISHSDNVEIELEAVRRGVTLRSVVARAWLEDPEAARSLAELVTQGERIAVVDALPVKLVIADHDVALLPLDPERDEVDEPVALVVHRSGLLTALAALFEQYFAKGWQLNGGPGPQPDHGCAEPAEPRTVLDPLDRQIVALLHVGLTDAAIARQLRIGHRTVQRRLRALMEEAGAATRFQLGWHTAVSGWLE
ncbi:hypothetical protein ACFWJU_16260 [Streptomyces mutabilis]|uniref:hypothetical protein n=1 Tax=Streptomyces mutabilis TaxID=67332 RepID=UPI00364ABACD